MASKITFFLFPALVISCKSPVSTAKAQHCIDSKDYPNTSCKIVHLARLGR
uniref:Lipoprotein n=1 Tax=Brassica oleracea TaxID=3712 RepID=A0A3P6DPD9_BRAOL|nr:unnamed protein product [Brassica oleracea]